MTATNLTSEIGINIIIPELHFTYTKNESGFDDADLPLEIEEKYQNMNDYIDMRSRQIEANSLDEYFEKRGDDPQFDDAVELVLFNL